MNLELLQPAWLLLAVPCAFALWSWRSRRATLDMLVLITVALCILSLAQPRITWTRPGGAVILLADFSKSMPPESTDKFKEAISLLEKSKGSEDLLGVIGFSEEASVEKLPDKGFFEAFRAWHSGTGSRIGDAIKSAVEIIPQGRNGRILLLSDGRFTGSSPFDAASLAASRGIPIDYRMIERPPWSDVSIESFDPPSSVSPGEAFQFSADIAVPADTEISYRLVREDVVVASGRTQLKSGRRRISFQDRLSLPGDVRYRLYIDSSLEDKVKENNCTEAMTNVSGGKPILIAGSQASRLPALASAGGIQSVQSKPEDVDWSLDGLSKYKALVLENVPALKLGVRGQEALKHFVESEGGGLMISGGRQSFGTGGYFATPLAGTLPVSMELRREHRKLTTAVVIALDRSGSMSIPVPGGKQKMDLANQGTVSALELLSDGDTIGVIAVDSQAHSIIEPTEVSGDKSGIASRILSIQSMGGGIFIYEALSHAANMLKDCHAGTRHIILFADAADSEEPGKYKELLKSLNENGITVSVIGLGTDRDCDAALLKEIALLGKGNIYFTNAAEELPQLFSQETIAVFRNSFVDEAAPLKKVEDLPLICSLPKEEPPPLGGFNLTYLRPGASAGLMTDDSYNAPVLAFWTKGAGRALAFTGEIDGKLTGPFGSWSRAGEIYLSCLRWINQSASKMDDPEVFISASSSSGQAKVSIELESERRSDPFLSTPELICLHESSEGIKRTSMPFEWKDKNSLEASVPVPPSGTIRLYAAVRKPPEKGGDIVIPCSTLCLPYPQEFTPERDLSRGRKTLMRLAELTGGVERVSLDGIFKEITPQRGAFPLWHILALAAASFLVMEIAARRLGITAASAAEAISSLAAAASRGADRVLGSRKPRNETKGENQKEGSPPSADKPEPPTPKDQPPPSSGSISGALSKAKDRSRRRTG